MYITQEPILLEKFFSFTANPACGAVATFAGIVRNHDHGCAVMKLYYECYPPMANKMMGELIRRARERWPVDEIRALHRVGELQIGEAAVAIAVSAAHRDEAFLACRFMIEGIKREAPIWKKQIFHDGSGEWVSCHAEAAVS